MRASTRKLFPHFYDERQTASAVEHIAHLDEQLIEDGTYFVHEADGEIVACGGWSRRYKLWAGEPSEDDTRLLDPRTEPAHPRDVRPPRLDPPRARAGDPGCVRGGRAGRGLPKPDPRRHAAG